MSFINEEGAVERSQSLWESSPWAKLEKKKGKILERSNSLVGSRSRATSTVEVDGRVAAVVIVDPFSTGAHLAVEIVNRGFKCVRVLSTWDSPVAALVQEGVVVEFDATIQYNDTLLDQSDSTNQVKYFNIFMSFQFNDYSFSYRFFLNILYNYEL